MLKQISCLIYKPRLDIAFPLVNGNVCDTVPKLKVFLSFFYYSVTQVFSMLERLA